MNYKKENERILRWAGMSDEDFQKRYLDEIKIKDTAEGEIEESSDASEES